MALILKQNQTYKNPSNGEITTAYAIIKYAGGWDAFQKMITFDVFVYSSQETRISGDDPINIKSGDRFSIIGNDYDTYIAGLFSDLGITTSMTLEDALAKIAYTYLLQATMPDPNNPPQYIPDPDSLTDTIIDPNNPGGTIPLQFGSIDMAKWIGDEVQ